VRTARPSNVESSRYGPNHDAIGWVMVGAWTKSPSPASSARRPARAIAILVVATVGLGLNLRAWIMLGPQMHERFGVGSGRYVVLMSLPLLVAALVRLPVGLLTDRYGARVMFPTVSLVAAAAVAGQALGGSLLAVVVAGSAAGVAGAAFVVGGAVVSGTFSYGRRGLALGVFSLGPAVAVLISAVFRGLDPDGRRAALVLGGLLVAFAGLAALVLRDHTGRHTSAPVRGLWEAIRLASGTSLSVLYGLALGGVMTAAVYLPVYLTSVLRLDSFHALTVTGSVVSLAAVARLVGGWWTDRRPTARLLVVCYAVGALLCLVAAAQPGLWWWMAPLIAAIAVCDGLAGGALLALIGKAARPESVGAVMGIAGTAAALGALLPPLLLAGAERLSQSHSAAWLLLAAGLLAAAVYVRAHSLRIGLGLAVPVEPSHGPPAMTVAVVGGFQIHLGAAAVVARLAELATSDELVVVYGLDEPTRPRIGANDLVTGLRIRLPRHNVVAVPVAAGTGALGRLGDLLGEFVDAGALAVALTRSADLRGVTAHVSSHLRADRVLVVSFTETAGADVREVWTRGTARALGA
jgi:MFS transporter, NNP family, nitrate/nitrite transporter